MSRNTASKVDNTQRRHWDKEEYAEKAAAQLEKDLQEAEEDEDVENPLQAKKRRRLERDPLHKGLIAQRQHLQGRHYQLNMTKRLGKTQVITSNTPLNQQAGYYCSVCECNLKDSQSYLDHINGKWHNRALGMSMRVQKSTVEQVRSRLEYHKRRRKDAQSKNAAGQ